MKTPVHVALAIVALSLLPAYASDDDPADVPFIGLWIDPDAFAAAIAMHPPALDERRSPAVRSPAQTATKWNRTDNKDGSAKITADRELDGWAAKVGVDFGVAPPADPALGPLAAQDRSTGVAWSQVAVPHANVPPGWDKASIDARLDSGAEHGRLSTTFSRSMPLGGVTVTLQNSYSVTQSLAGTAGQQAPLAGAQSWGTEQALKFRILPTDTTFSAGTSLSSIDNQWHHQLGAEQKIYGPLNVTTSITDPGSPTSNKKVTAGFTARW